MRLTVRAVMAVLAVLCALATLVAVAPSQADPSPYSASPAGTAAIPTRGLPRREMNDEVFRNNKGWLVFKGNVDPGWNNKNVQIYKRPCKGCAWTLVKKTRTDGSGRWRTRIYAPRTGAWYWKGLVPKSGGYGRSVTQTWRTFVE